MNTDDSRRKATEHLRSHDGITAHGWGHDVTHDPDGNNYHRLNTPEGYRVVKVNRKTGDAQTLR